MTEDVFILAGARTPMGEYSGALRDLSAIELGAIAARATLERSNMAPENIDHVVIGNALQTSGDAIYGARHVALKAGVPIDKPALTVNRLCGSGIQAIVSGAQMIQLREANTVLVERELGLDRERTNVNGGAIALGHPLAASGTRLVFDSSARTQASGKALRPRYSLHRRRSRNRYDRRSLLALRTEVRVTRARGST